MNLTMHRPQGVRGVGFLHLQMPRRGLIKVTKYNAAQSWRGPSPQTREIEPELTKGRGESRSILFSKKDSHRDNL